MATKITLGSPPDEVNKETQDAEPEEVLEENPVPDQSPPAEEATDEPSGEEPDEGVDLESLDPTLEVWPGGPTVGQTIEWKDQFGEVYTTSLTLDFHVMWRPINRLEYKKHVKQMEQISQSGKLSPVELNMFQEEALTELCVLFPQYSKNEMATELAGMPSIIAQQVMEASGFTALEVRQL